MLTQTEDGVIYQPSHEEVNVVLRQGEDLSDLLVRFGFSLAGFLITSKAEVRGYRDRTWRTIDLLPVIGGAGSDEVTFGVTSATLQAEAPGKGHWDVFLTDGAGVGRAYVQGEFTISPAGSY